MSQVKKFYDKYYTDKRPLKPVNLLDRLYGLLRGFETDRYQIARSMALPLSGKLLDIGCGNCAFLNMLPAHFEKYGVDISDVGLHNNQDVNIRIFSRDLNDTLPFSDRMFDVVTSLSVLEHLFDVYFQVREYSRILKPGGVLILEVPNVAFLPNRLRLLFGSVPITSTGDWTAAWDDNHLHYFVRKRLAKLLEENGLHVEKVSGAGVAAALRNWWPSLLCGDLIFLCRKQ